MCRVAGGSQGRSRSPVGIDVRHRQFTAEQAALDRRAETSRVCVADGGVEVDILRTGRIRLGATDGDEVSRSGFDFAAKRWAGLELQTRGPALGFVRSLGR